MGLGIRGFRFKDGDLRSWALRVEGLKAYLEGQGDLVSRLRMGINRVTIWVIEVINLLTKSP